MSLLNFHELAEEQEWKFISIAYFFWSEFYLQNLQKKSSFRCKILFLKIEFENVNDSCKDIK